MEEPREWPTGAPSVRSAAVTLVGIREGIPGPVYATKVAAKRLLLAGTTGRLYGFWRGRYTSDLFVIPRLLAEEQVGVDPDAKAQRDPKVENLLQWWFEEAKRQGKVTVRLSRAAPAIRSAKLLLGAAHGRRIQSVGQYALANDYWRAKVVTVSDLWKWWDRIVPDWERDGAPAYVEGWKRGDD